MAVSTTLSCSTAQYYPTCEFSVEPSRITWPAAASNAFSCNFVDNGHRNSIQLSNLCTTKKTFLKSLSISDEILSNLRGRGFFPRGHPPRLKSVGSLWNRVLTVTRPSMFEIIENHNVAADVCICIAYICAVWVSPATTTCAKITEEIDTNANSIWSNQNPIT